MNIDMFQQHKKQNKKISMVTCYDYNSATIIAATDIHCILVGDSVAMVVHGFDSTIPADIPMMVLHTAAVARGAKNKFIVADMPFCSYRKGIALAVDAAEQLIKAGAHAVKLEGAHGNLEIISHLVHSGIPVMGHLGLTPQSIHVMGGFKVQGKNKSQAEILKKEAQQLQEAGCFSLVLECIPAPIAKEISHACAIPTIGIGAGPDTDGQVLVYQDLLGLNPNFTPKFLKRYLNGFEVIQSAIQNYHQEVTEQHFPRVPEHCFL